jgi:hypothetical protein
MSEALGLLTGIVRPIPGVSTFVTPVFRQSGGRIVTQLVDDDGRVTGFDPICLGEGFESLSENHVVYENDPALYAFELESGRIAFGSAPGLANLLLKADPQMFSATERRSRSATLAAVRRFLIFAESLKSKHSRYSFVCADSDRDQSSDSSPTRDRLSEQKKFSFWMSFVEACKVDFARCLRSTDPVPWELRKYRLGNAIRALGEFVCNDKSLYQLPLVLKSYEAALEVYSLTESSADTLTNLRALGRALKILQSARHADKESEIESRFIQLVRPVDATSLALRNSKAPLFSDRSLQQADMCAPHVLKHSRRKRSILWETSSRTPSIFPKVSSAWIDELPLKWVVGEDNEKILLRRRALVRHHSIPSEFHKVAALPGVLVDHHLVLTAFHVKSSAIFKEVRRSAAFIRADFPLADLGWSPSDDAVGCEASQGSLLVIRCLLDVLEFVEDYSLPEGLASSVAVSKRVLNNDNFGAVHLIGAGMGSDDLLRPLRAWMTDTSGATKVDLATSFALAVVYINSCLNSEIAAYPVCKKCDDEARDSVAQRFLRVAARFQKEQAEYEKVIDPIWKVSEEENFKSVMRSGGTCIIPPLFSDGGEYYDHAFQNNRGVGSKFDEKAERLLALVCRCTSSKLVAESVIALGGVCKPSAAGDAVRSILEREGRESDWEG